MGFLSSKKKTRSESEIIPLNEREHSTYKVKQVFKVGHGKSDKEQRVIMLTEEGVKIMEVSTGVCIQTLFSLKTSLTHPQDIIATVHWRDMMWFEVRPATREWVIHTKKTSRFEDKFRFVTSEAIKIHAEAESFLDRFIRNYKLSLYEAERQPDIACVQELLDEAVSFMNYSSKRVQLSSFHIPFILCYYSMTSN